MSSFSSIDPALLQLAEVPFSDMEFLSGPKGGQCEFFATEAELLTLIKESPPAEWAPYVVTYDQEEFSGTFPKPSKVESLHDFQGWIANRTYTICIWPERFFAAVQQRKSLPLEHVARSLSVAVQVFPIELFGKDLIPEEHSRLWVRGSARLWARGLHYLNEVPVRIYSTLRRRLRAQLRHTTIICFPNGAETEVRSMGMTDQAAGMLSNPLVSKRYKPGSIRKF